MALHAVYVCVCVWCLAVSQLISVSVQLQPHNFSGWKWLNSYMHRNKPQVVYVSVCCFTWMLKFIFYSLYMRYDKWHGIYCCWCTMNSHHKFECNFSVTCFDVHCMHLCIAYHMHGYTCSSVACWCMQVAIIIICCCCHIILSVSEMNLWNILDTIRALNHQNAIYVVQELDRTESILSMKLNEGKKVYCMESTVTFSVWNECES